MNLERDLDQIDFERLKEKMLDIAQKHATVHIRAFGSAAGLTQSEYFNKVDIIEYQKVQKLWFTKHFKTKIYDVVFEHGPPATFLPGKAIRENIFLSGLIFPARRMFMGFTIAKLIDAINNEWKLHGAKPSPKAALYF